MEAVWIVLGITALIVAVAVEFWMERKKREHEMEKKDLNVQHYRQMKEIEDEKDRIEKDYKLKEIMMVENCSREEAEKLQFDLIVNCMRSEFEEATGLIEKRAVVKKMRIKSDAKYNKYFTAYVYCGISDEKKVQMIDKYLSSGQNANVQLLKETTMKDSDLAAAWEKKDSTIVMSDGELKQITTMFCKRFAFATPATTLKSEKCGGGSFSWDEASLVEIWLQCLFFSKFQALWKEWSDEAPPKEMNCRIRNNLHSLFFEIVQYDVRDYDKILDEFFCNLEWDEVNIGN